jgi:hypothetical protein
MPDGHIDIITHTPHKTDFTCSLNDYGTRNDSCPKSVSIF